MYLNSNKSPDRHDQSIHYPFKRDSSIELATNAVDEKITALRKHIKKFADRNNRKNPENVFSINLHLSSKYTMPKEVKLSLSINFSRKSDVRSSKIRRVLGPDRTNA